MEGNPYQAPEGLEESKASAARERLVWRVSRFAVLIAFSAVFGGIAAGSAIAIRLDDWTAWLIGAALGVMALLVMAICAIMFRVLRR